MFRSPILWMIPKINIPISNDIRDFLSEVILNNLEKKIKNKNIATEVYLQRKDKPKNIPAIQIFFFALKNR